MPTHRMGKVWSPGTGWVQKQAYSTRDYSDLVGEWWAFLIWVFRWYPDKCCDVFRSEDADFPNEEFYQRLMMRAYARYSDVAFTGTRGITKTDTKMKYEIVNGIVWPGSKSSYFGPSLKQTAGICAQAFEQFRNSYPILANHWRTVAQSKDDFVIETDCGSRFQIDIPRGSNVSCVTAEEFAQEDGIPFDFDRYTTVVLPAVRVPYKVDGKPDKNYVLYKTHSITSAGRKQNHSFQVREDALKSMQEGGSAFAYDMSWEVVILQQMRPWVWAEKMRKNLTPDKWMREMESRYTGTDEFPVITEDTMMESCCLLSMERQHICKYQHSNVNPNDVIYIIGYDVSYENAKVNALCACVVLKLTKQKDFLKKDKFLKQMVYIDDWPPPDNAMVQARRLKDIWYRFCYDGGNATYIAIDSWQYGKGVVELLMQDLGDGLPPLCVKDHAKNTEIELDGAIPIIYPIKAGGTGVTDPDFEMLKYAQTEFDNHNVQLLTMNAREGVEAYKRLHRIPTDDMDYRIVRPYQKTRVLCGQISNLKMVPSGSGMSEKRISSTIQRDSWSALKYALRLANILEREEYLKNIEVKSTWSTLRKQFEKGGNVTPINSNANRRLVSGGRRGGRLF